MKNEQEAHDFLSLNFELWNGMLKKHFVAYKPIVIGVAAGYCPESEQTIMRDLLNGSTGQQRKINWH